MNDTFLYIIQYWVIIKYILLIVLVHMLYAYLMYEE